MVDNDTDIRVGLALYNVIMSLLAFHFHILYLCYYIKVTIEYITKSCRTAPV